MEASKEDLTLLHKILPPRLEDAGLEDCALPSHSIHQAFLKAASAVGCVSDPGVDESPPSDAVVGVEPEIRPVGPCTTEKGGAWVGDGGDVVVVGERNEEDNEKKDDVVVVGGDGGSGSCVDGLKGLDVKDKDKEREIDEDDDQKKKKPTLIEDDVI
ncbi:Protein HIR1 [Bienertia sinuspersici]